MKFLDLFSGIGGFALGLERAGHETVAFCESDLYCQRVLKRHWPHLPCYPDVRQLTANTLRADGITVVDGICGGFPCQDISHAGRGIGIAGERSGLWTEYARIIGELRPRYVIVENVANLLGRGLDHILGNLATLGYDAEWHCIPASAVGAPHRRDRVWLVAHPAREYGHGSGDARAGRRIEFTDGNGTVADADNQGQLQPQGRQPEGGEWAGNGGEVSDANGPRLERRLRASLRQCARQQAVGSVRARWVGDTWEIEPDMGRVANGVSNRVDRLRTLGNAVVPQIPEIIGQAIK